MNSSSRPYVMVPLALVALVVGGWVVISRTPSTITINHLALTVSHCLLDKYDPESCRTIRQKLTASEAPRSYQWRSLLALAEGDDEAAIDDARRAAAQAPGDDMLQGFLATVYERTGYWNVAVEQYVALARVKPTAERAATYQLLIMGIQAYREGKLGDAVEALEAAWAISPGDPGVAYYLAYASYWKGDLLRAIAVLRQALDMHPNDPMSGPNRETLERYESFSK